jgi:hypothetical protein
MYKRTILDTTRFKAMIRGGQNPPQPLQTGFHVENHGSTSKFGKIVRGGLRVHIF